MLPDVTTILFKREIEYEQFFCFNLKNTVSINEVEKRNKTYQTNEFREALKMKYADYTEYIKALEIRIDIHEAISIEYNRISELTQRTNRCTNGKRYTVAEIKEHMNSNMFNIYSVSVSDRFSDLGLVGVIEVKNDILTLFSLSCRALGRDIEKKMLSYIGNMYQINSIEYNSTGKNEAVKILLAETFPNALLKNIENF